jgi:hypothetical protein
MKKITTLLTILGVFLFLSALPALAQHGGAGGHGGNPGMGPGGGMGEPSGMGQQGGMGSHGDMGQQGTMGPSGDMGRGMGHSSSNMPMNNSSRSVSASSPTNLLSTNSKLNSTLNDRLSPLLPSGMSLTDAASGFKNLGQFVAAVHVSHNLDIPFTDLKDKMTSGDSLGKAIHALKPDVKAKSEAKKAEKQAKADVKAAANKS